MEHFETPSPDASHNPDILTCLANLSSDEVFTPPRVARELLDLLPTAIWTDPTLKFLDPGCKTGIFLREITSRLMHGLTDIFPERESRLDHILSKQVYGIAITELTALITRRTLYCSKLANSTNSIFSGSVTPDGNIFYKPLKHTWRSGFCLFCGAGQSVYDRSDSSESYAYNFLHESDFFDGTHFDVIVGGPPFQLYDGGGTGSSARPVYQKFIEKSLSLSPKHILMVTPARWYSGGKGLDDFRQAMLSDRRIEKLIDHPDTRSVFPTDIAGGICYFLWSKSHSGPCEVSVVRDGNKVTSHRFLDEFETFVRDTQAVEIIKKVRHKSKASLEDLVSSRKPFGLDSMYRGSAKGDLELRTSKGWAKTSRAEVLVGQDFISVWKVLLSKASNDHGGQADKSGYRRIFSRIEILAPGQVCTESYLIVGAFSSQKEAENMVVFLKSRFCRFLVSTVLLTHNISKGSFKYVPSMSMKDVWTDERLNVFFGLSKDEVVFINGLIKSID